MTTPTFSKRIEGYIYLSDLLKYLDDQQKATQGIANVPIHDGYSTMLHNTALGSLSMLEQIRAWANDEANKNLQGE